MQDLLGVPITASTIFDQCEYLSNALYPVFTALFKIAGRSKHFYLDDTTNRILNHKSQIKKVRNSDKTRVRTGVYTSGVIATSQDNQRIVLFETSIGHAGEFIDSILANRPKTYSPPLLMSDALPSNRPSKVQVKQCFCNSHARRQFYDVLSHFPDEVNEIIERYSQVWTFEQEARAYQLNARSRLAYHKLNSLPVMEAILHWGQAHFTHKTVEENSGLGNAIRYFIVIIQRISETFNKKCIFIEKHSHFILTNTRKLECANEMMCGVYSLLAVMFDSKIRQLSIK